MAYSHCVFSQILTDSQASADVRIAAHVSFASLLIPASLRLVICFPVHSHIYDALMTSFNLSGISWAPIPRSTGAISEHGDKLFNVSSESAAVSPASHGTFLVMQAANFQAADQLGEQKPPAD